MMDVHQRQELQRILSDYRLTPATLATKLTQGRWIAKKHLLYISSRVARGIAQGNARIIISAPPRHGKSELTSVHTPVWVLEKFPRKHVVMTSYGADLSVGFGRRVRDTFVNADNHALLNTRIRRDSSKVTAFNTLEGGGMFSVGLGGPITGRGADVLLIDDYIKEIKEALSPAYRDYIWNWFTTTAYTRLEPGGSCIIIATRWHSDDLIGRILATYPGAWEYIEIPAIATEGDILGREVGEALFPERYPIEVLQERKTVLGSVFFDALYQQRPVDESKKMTDSNWFKVARALPPGRKLKYGRFWDLAATQDGGDYLVGTLCAYDPITQEFFVINVIRRQVSPGEAEKTVEAVATVDGPDIPVYIEREPGSAGKLLINHFATSVLPGHTVKEVPVANRGGKLIRAQPFLAAAEAGKVTLIEGSWNTVFTREFESFPGGTNDDQIDTAAAGYTELSGKRTYSASWGRKPSTTLNGPGGGSGSGAAAHKTRQQQMQKAAVSIGIVRTGSKTRGASWGR